MFQKLIDKASDFLENRIQALRLEVQGELTRVIPLLLFRVVQALVAMLLLLFLFLGVALLLNEVLDSIYWGYFIVAGFFMVVLLMVVAMARSPKVQAAIQRQLEEQWFTEHGKKHHD